MTIAARDNRIEAPRLMHPLSGSNLATLVGVLLENRGVARARLPQAALALAATVARWPFTTAERLYVARRLRTAAPMPPPIFIVGHWRSGTTHLYNVMARAGFGYVSPLAAGMPWDLMGIVALLKPVLVRALPRHRYIDNVPVHTDSPQEDEVALANMTRISFYHGLYFPERFAENFNRGVFFDGLNEREIAAWQQTFTYLLEKLWLHQSRRLLIKNPVYTARIGMLHAMMPGAKFIHVHRNPYAVFESMRNFYAKLFPKLALQSYRHVAVDDVVLATYPRMMDRLIADSRALPKGAFVEIAYDTLVANPMAALAGVYDGLGLEGFETARPHFAAYLGTVKSYRSNAYDYAPDTMARVTRAWGRYLDHWGYPRLGGKEALSA